MNEPIREFERVTVTRIRAVRGEGIEGDPVREVTAWFKDDGTLIAYEDAWTDKQKKHLS